MTVLICEDGEVLLTALEFRLKKNGYDIILAKNGKEAMTQLEMQLPDMVIADIQSSQVTGLEMLRYLREDRKSKLPFIMLADLENADALLEAFQLNTTDFVSKPFNPNELILRIRRIFDELGKE